MGLLDILGGSGAQRGGGSGMSPITMALLGLLAYRTYQGKGRLADMIGRKPDASGAASGGGLGDLLGGLTGGAGAGAAAGGLGGLLSGGLGDLLKQFQQHGQEDKAQSWVSTGPNKPVSPHEVEQALGPEKIAWLMEQTGMPREELLAGLSRELPEAVDKLTPEGRVPTEQEAARLLQ
jgi:uncharacterized protein YidB (DUF937 family)